jgi:transcriptional regulator with XRE-family HTH domain
MTPTEFRATRLRLGLTTTELAAVLGYAHVERVRAYESVKMNKTVPLALERLMRAYEEGYRPFDWPAREGD